jgi:hypothetical protein
MEFSQILKTVAPWIASAVSGPFAPLAVNLAVSALGGSEKTAEGLKKAIAGASPEALLALKQADYDFQLKMQELGFKSLADLEAIAAADRASARDLQKAVRSNVPATLSVIYVVGFFGLLAGMLTGHFNVADDSQAMILMLGSLSTGVGMVMAYWFGTTNSSAVKTDIIARSPAIEMTKDK